MANRKKASSKRALGASFALTAVGAVALVAVVIGMFEPYAAWGPVRAFFFMFTGSYWPLTKCPGMMEDGTPPTFKFKRILKAETPSKPLDEAWFKTVKEPTLVHIPGLVQAGKEYTTRYADEQVLMRTVPTDSNCSMVPRSALAFSNCWSQKFQTEKSYSMAQVLAGVENENMYAFSLSLNKTNTMFQRFVDQKFFWRNDVFFGHFRSPGLTGGFHAALPENSVAMQLVGHKVWMFIPPYDAKRTVGFFPAGGWCNPAHLCDENLKDVELTYTITGPGDVITFPNAWPHFVMTLPGPNLLINSRNFNKNVLLSPWDTYTVATMDRVALIMGFISTLQRRFFSRSYKEAARNFELAKRVNGTQSAAPGVGLYIVDQMRDLLEDTTDPETYVVWPLYEQLCKVLQEDDAAKHAHRQASPELARSLSAIMKKTCPAIYQQKS